MVAPSSTASDSSRPHTNSTYPHRPTTSAGIFDRDNQYTYSQDYSQEEDEESEVEDVFAFLPPSTPDPHQADTLTTIESFPQPPPLQLTTVDPPTLPQPSLPVQVTTLESSIENLESSEPPPIQLTTVEPPTLPQLSLPVQVTTVESNLESSQLPQLLPIQLTTVEPSIIPYPPPPPLPISLESPPSTESQSISIPDDPSAFRMHRINNSGTTHVTTTVHDSIPSPSSREIPIGFPSPSLVSEKDSQMLSKFRLSSNDDSVMTPSMIEGDSREGSTKSVSYISCPLHRLIALFSNRMEFDFDSVEEEDSPYPEVRASVSNIDDPDMPAMTIRMWFVGLFLCMISTFVFPCSFPVNMSLILNYFRAMNVFFNFRMPAPIIVPLALVLIAHPFGKLLAFILPITPYRLPRYLASTEISLNPGPWNIKEHALVFIMANVAVSPPYAMNAIVVMENFYEIKMDYWFNLVLVLGTQLTGFGIAGLCRRFLVWPASMVWPQNLVACTLLNTLHAEDDEGAGGITRYKFFMIVLTCSFFFFFLPGKHQI